MIYLDNAATSFYRPPGVERAVVEALRTLGNSGRGAHEPTLGASRLIYGAREQLARLFHAPDASRIAFTCNATEALNTALLGLFSPGDHIITTVSEHNSVLRPLYEMEGRGIAVTHLAVDEAGRLLYDKLEESRTEHTRAVVVTHASNLTGNVTDLGRVSEFAGKYGLLLIVDAAQTAGVLPIDVEKYNIDVLCFTGHKGLMGPQGTGGLYVRPGLSVRPLKTGGSGSHSYDRHHPSVMPEALEAGTLNGHGIAGLSAALSFIEEAGVTELHEKALGLARRFAEGAGNIRGVRLYGDYAAAERAAIVTLNIGGEDSAAVCDWLWEHYGICVRGGAHCAPLLHRALKTGTQGAVRFSFSCYNTKEEVEVALRAVRKLSE